MAVYYNSNRENMQSLYQEPIYQQVSSSSTQSFSQNPRNEMVFIPPTTTDLQNASGNVVSSNELSFHGQGLSLSLGTQIQTTPLVSVPNFHYHQYQNLSNQLGFVPNSVKETLPCEVDEAGKSKEMLLDQNQHMGYGVNIGFYNNYRYETSGFVSSVLRSRYLKPAQTLLDEVVSVRKDVNKNKGGDFNNGLSLDSKESELSANPSDSNGKSPELSSGERQDLQNKKNKLLTMVDEVDKRYNQYYHQMEALASSFEIIAGFGAAKPYTSVALNRISRHFRSLRDAIKGQVQVIKVKLGEKESSDEQGERIPRLRYLDQRLRQQRALHQQLGMVRPAWRPQRGLPENAVSILRAWLFEHFLHPYPKESEKIMLAKQTGLSKNQVANWFINARVRLWKPMIEEMYKEEFGDSESSFLSKSSQEQNTFNNEEENNNNLTTTRTTNLVFSEQKQDSSCVQDETQQEMNRSEDYDDDDGLMNYNGFGIDEYRFIGGGNQQDVNNRFSNSHQLHDFVV